MYIIRETILGVFNLDGSLHWFFSVVTTFDNFHLLVFHVFVLFFAHPGAHSPHELLLELGVDQFPSNLKEDAVGVHKCTSIKPP
jgi:hypothetical protein